VSVLSAINRAKVISPSPRLLESTLNVFAITFDLNPAEASYSAYWRLPRYGFSAHFGRA
jgi:hypothetical protein